MLVLSTPQNVQTKLYQLEFYSIDFEVLVFYLFYPDVSISPPLYAIIVSLCASLTVYDGSRKDTRTGHTAEQQR